MPTEVPAFDLESLKLTSAGRSWFPEQHQGVPGPRPGWVVLLVWDTTGVSGVTFYPDAKHEWDGGTLRRSERVHHVFADMS